MYREVIGSSHRDSQMYRDTRHAPRDQMEPYRDKHQRGYQDIPDQGPYIDQHRRGYRDQSYTEQQYISKNQQSYPNRQNEQDSFRDTHHQGDYRDPILDEQYSNKNPRGHREPPLGMAHQSHQSSQAHGSPEVRRHRQDYARNSPKRYSSMYKLLFSEWNAKFSL